MEGMVVAFPAATGWAGFDCVAERTVLSKMSASLLKT
jgi:hypothetical protein